MRNQQLVREFMAKHNFTEGLIAHQDSPQARALWYEAGLRRSSLIGEELAELEAAWAKRDLVEVADAIADLLYVVYGAAVNAGIPADAMQAVFEEVHASNMTKEPKSGARDGEKPRGASYRKPDIVAVLARFKLLREQREVAQQETRIA